MTPHGSKWVEWIRVLSNRYLSDRTRKKIKRVIGQLRSIPLQVLGIQSELDGMREELERVKAKLNHLEGEVRFRENGSLFSRLGEGSDGTSSPHS